jgi:DNA gyrase/topoisomerase IV subunit A
MTKITKQTKTKPVGIPVVEQKTQRPIIDFVRYAMKHYGEEVMLNRALPRIEDGLKPVQRLLLWSSMDIGGDRFIKSAKISGHCIASYSPHGEKAAYDAMVRMVNERHPLMEGQGNFGGATTEPASARYTEARIHPFARQLSTDLPDWKSIPYEKNYDDTKNQPQYIPTALPLILLNSSAGIAMAITSKFPGFNVGEVAAAVDTYFKTGSAAKAAACITAPDGADGRILTPPDEIAKLLSSGEGSITYECRHKVEQRGKHRALIVSGYVPEFSVSSFLKRCAEMQDDDLVIATRNETSGKNGDRIVVEFETDEALAKIKKLLVKKVGYRMTCLVPGKAGLSPQTMGVGAIIATWCDLRSALVGKTLAGAIKERLAVLRREKIKLQVAADVPTLVKLLQEADPDATIAAHFQLNAEEVEYVMGMRLDSLKKTSVEIQQKRVKQAETEVTKAEQEAKSPAATARRQATESAAWISKNMPLVAARNTEVAAVLNTEAKSNFVKFEESK